MAITKILYRNGGLRQAIDYITNPSKTDEQLLTDYVRCDPGYAAQQMMDTKRALEKTDGRQCYSSFESRITTMLEDVRKLKSLIDELEQPLEAFDEKLFHEIVTDICINNRDEMTVTLLGGLKFTEQI